MNVRLYPSDCKDDLEFSELQRVRGYLSGIARRKRVERRNRAMVSSRRAGMKIFAIALRFGVSVATVHRAVTRRARAYVYPRVPDVLAALYGAASYAFHEPSYTREVFSRSYVRIGSWRIPKDYDGPPIVAGYTFAPVLIGPEPMDYWRT